MKVFLLIVTLLAATLAMPREAAAELITAIKLTSPRPGDVWQVGSTYPITWESLVVGVTDVQIGFRDTRYDYNIDTGEQTLAYRIPNTGSYLFTVPETLDDLSLGTQLSGSHYTVIVYPWDDNFAGLIGEESGLITIIPEPASLTLFPALCLLRRRR